MARVEFIPFKIGENIRVYVQKLDDFIKDKVYLSAFQQPQGFIIFYEIYEKNSEILKEIEEITND